MPRGHAAPPRPGGGGARKGGRAPATTRTSRIGWALSHMIIAVGGTLVILTAAGTAIGLGHGARAGSLGDEVARMAGAALAQQAGREDGALTDLWGDFFQQHYKKMSPDEVAAAVAFLASDEASYFVGDTLKPSGGFTTV